MQIELKRKFFESQSSSVLFQNPVKESAEIDAPAVDVGVEIISAVLEKTTEMVGLRDPYVLVLYNDQHKKTQVRCLCLLSMLLQ